MLNAKSTPESPQASQDGLYRRWPERFEDLTHVFKAFEPAHAAHLHEQGSA